MISTHSAFTFKAGVIGLGRVGLPLALSLVEAGVTVLGCERSESQLKEIRDGRMPFHEPGYDQIAASKKLAVTCEHSRMNEVEHIIITVGTPLRHHVETDLSQVIHVVMTIIPFLREGQTIILRSTVAPQTTECVRRLLLQHTPFEIGKNLFLAFCPERLAGGKAKQELATLPQIVGAEDAESLRRASKLFEQLGVKTLATNYVSAELAKLFCNIYRYVNFAIANNFALIADHYGANVFEIIRMTNDQYPRSKIPHPGFAAGACLRKDFGMISEDIPYSDLFVSAWRVNEHTPRFLVLQLKERTTIFNKTIAVLGATFKRDSDDVRDSLTPKLVRYLEREVPKAIHVHDPHLGKIISEERENYSYTNQSMHAATHEADIIFLAMNHTDFEQSFTMLFEQARVGTWFIDLWNISHRDQIFFRK